MSHNQIEHIRTKYLPLKKFHIVPISNITPNEIKVAAKQCYCDREKIPHTTRLNAIAKSLGIDGGFSGFKETYKNILLPFMQEHSLIRRVDLFHLRKDEHRDWAYGITPERLSNRLFFSGRPIPSKVFTGYNFNIKHTLGDGIWLFHHMSPEILQNYNLRPTTCSLPANNVLHNLEVASKNPDMIIPVARGTRRLEDVVIGGLLFDIGDGINLIGDTLIWPKLAGDEFQRYAQKGYVENETVTVARKSSILAFRRRIDRSNDGWVDIIPFNKKLVFLRGKDGQFDFIFSGLKDKCFEHIVYDEALKISDIPSFDDSYVFDRWKYFTYKGWLEKDSHESEKLFYKNGGTTLEYPGQDEILKDYFRLKGLLNAVPKASTNSLSGFKKITLQGKTLGISSLITIAEFKKFLRKRPDYLEYRAGENWSLVNAEISENLPVTVNWFDILVYTKWLEEATNLDFRLLTVDEHLELREKLMPQNVFSNHDRSDLVWLDPQGKEYGRHPPHMDWDIFDNQVTCKFHPDLSLKYSDQLSFLLSNSFAEWMLEKTCIRSGNLKSFNNTDILKRDLMGLSSTGKYKGVKIGFRLCYEVS